MQPLSLWSNLSRSQRTLVCDHLHGGDEREARVRWAEMRAHFSLLCGGMPPKPWLGEIQVWCLEVESRDRAFSPIAFRWSCPPVHDVALGSVLTLDFSSDYTFPVARGFSSLVSELVLGLG